MSPTVSQHSESSETLGAMPSLTSFTQITLMLTLGIPRVMRPSHTHSFPLLDPIRYSFHIRLLIQRGSAAAIARLAVLTVDSGIVSIARVHSDRNGDFLTRPSVGFAVLVVAGKFPHDVCVICLNVTFVVVDVVEFEAKVVFSEEL